jgi:ATP phosphoribosyltransferase
MPMRASRWAVALLLAIPVVVRGEARQGRQSPSEQSDPERAIGQLIGDLQSDLEASSSSDVLGAIDRTRFEDFERFRDSVERLTREDTLRVYFRQLSSTVKDGEAQTVLEAEMEMTRKDSTLQAQQRKQQVTIDLARRGKGWKIINITPREFFEPL